VDRFENSLESSLSIHGPGKIFLRGREHFAALSEESRSSADLDGARENPSVEIFDNQILSKILQVK
jgi:hypothetical protein